MPGDAVLNAATQDGQYKLILACLYVLVGIDIHSLIKVYSQVVGDVKGPKREHSSQLPNS